MKKINSEFFQFADTHTESYVYNGRTIENDFGIFESADGKQSFITPMNATLSRMLKLGEWIKSPQFNFKLNRGTSKASGKAYNIQSLSLVAWQAVSDEERAELSKLNVAQALAQVTNGPKSDDSTPSSPNADGGVRIGD